MNDVALSELLGGRNNIFGKSQRVLMQHQRELNAKALVQLLRQLLWREHRHPCCRQFDGEWYSVETPADFRNVRNSGDCPDSLGRLNTAGRL